jgi:hypothetical protein
MVPPTGGFSAKQPDRLIVDPATTEGVPIRTEDIIDTLLWARI